jgi:outer membrane receptor protein involved in Fe transport
VGVTQENFDRNTIIGTASNLIGSQSNLDQAGNRNLSQDRLIQEDKGFFAQEEVNWNDQIIATVGLRADKSSNNGDPNEIFYYPKASLAFNVHNFNFWNLNDVSQLKLRAAFGQSGNFAVFGDKFTSFAGGVIGGLPAAVIGLQKGNPIVQPERQTEFEFGFDLGLIQNRFSIDFTYYIKTVDDLLLSRDVPTSSGFQAEVVNAADLENKGTEIGLSANLFQGSDFEWFTRIGWWKNDATVTRLSIPSYTDVGFSVGLGTFRIMEGRSPTEIISVGPAELQDETGVVVFGDAEPDFQMTFYNEFSWKNFDLTFLWHWKNGGEGINLSSLLFDDGETTHDWDDTSIDGVNPNGIARLLSIGTANHAYIQDAGYLRLREVGLYYSLPEDIIDNVNLKFGFSGNNLLNFFDYDSYDPEVSNFGSGGLTPGVEVNPFPSAKRFNFHVIADF